MKKICLNNSKKAPKSIKDSKIISSSKKLYNHPIVTSYFFVEHKNFIHSIQHFHSTLL